LANKREKIYVNLNLNVRGLPPSATLQINEKCNILIAQGKTIYKLGLGQSPFPVPDSVVEALRKNAHQKRYLPVKGLPELKEAVAAYNLRFQNIKCTANDILIGPGSKELLFLLQLVYYGDLVIPTPSWVSYSPQARIIGRNVQWVPTQSYNNWRMTPEKLEMICRSDPDRPRILILNYPANPTGCTYTMEMLKELAEVARKYKVVLISDEIYGQINHKGQHVSIARFYPEGTIISSGLSKWCGAGGWRLGTFTFPSSLRWMLDAMAIVASETYTATSSPIQYAAIRAFEGGSDIDDYLHHVRRILRALGKIFYEKTKKLNLTLPKPEGAFYLFPDFHEYRLKFREYGVLTSGEMCKFILDKTGIAMLPGVDFGRPPEELTARIAYVDFDGAKALEASMQLYKHLDLDEGFAELYTPKLVKAFDKLGKWLRDL
jgi:aspartate aminotransferase